MFRTSVLAGRLTIEMGCWLPSKLRTIIFDFYCGGFSNFSPYSIFSDSSNGPQEWCNFSGVKVSLFGYPSIVSERESALKQVLAGWVVSYL